MNFAKQTKKYYAQDLKRNLTNNFKFSIKNLCEKCDFVQGLPILCKGCQQPLSNQKCQICSTLNEQKGLTQQSENIVYKQKMDENNKMVYTMILCVDLSGSMSITYKSKYNKVNQDLVIRKLGQKNFEFLKKKLGLQAVLQNYQTYQMLLQAGDSAKNIVETFKMQQTYKNASSSENTHKKDQKEVKEQQMKSQYISRKQMIEIAVDKYITMMKTRNPNTFVTVVYFNNTIQIPIDAFNDKLTVCNAENKTIEEMIHLGMQYSSKISKAKASNIGQNLVFNLSKAVENGATAMGPALAFCFGLAKDFKSTLHQIVVITDGMSNVGFGQTEDQLQHQQAKKFYQNLALQYAKPLNCVVNIITFQDCCIGYEVIDQMVQITGGIPCQIQFTQLGGQKIVTQQTFSNICFKFIQGFLEYPKQLLFNTKIAISCNNEKVKLKVRPQLEPFIKEHKGHFIILQTGIKAIGTTFDVQFSIDEKQQDFQGSLKFLVICQYEKNQTKIVKVQTQKIKVTKGTEEQVKKQEIIAMQKQIKSQLKPRQIFEEDIKVYKNISQKLQENENLSNEIDQQLLTKFNKKKLNVENEFKNIDKLSRQKMSMRSRAQRTYKEMDAEYDDGFS